MPGLQGTAADEGFAWGDVELAAAPLAASRLALLQEQYPGISPTAFKAMVIDGAQPDEVDRLEDERPETALVDRPPRASESVVQLTGERSA